MKWIHNLLLLFLLISVHLVNAQISGRIYNETTGHPLSFITIQNQEYSAETDFSGYFEITGNIDDTLYLSRNDFYLGWVIAKEKNVSIYLNLELLTLDEVVISTFNENKSLQKIAGSIVTLDKKTLSETDNQTIVQAMNSLPGVQFEERSPGSYRINIRGSSIRAPFDVRNVKVYWNGIPITEPGGSTPFNLLDPGNMESIEVFKGPSSLYGAGNGGVILLNSYPSGDSLNGNVGFQLGSYGLRRFHGRLNNVNDRSRTLLQYANHHYSGYREHSRFNRSSVEYSGQHKLDSNQFLLINFLFADLFYQIPGGLTKQQLKEDPTQSRPGNPFAMGTKESNSSIDVKNLLMGIGHKIFRKNYNHYTNVYAIMTDFTNPFIFDYKKEAHAGFGFRTLLEQNIETLPYPLSIKAGVEHQKRLASARNFGNDSGEADTLNFDDNIISTQWMAFVQSEVILNEGLSVSASLSLSHLTYDIERIYDAVLNDGYYIKRSFDLVAAPRIGGVWQAGSKVYYLTYSRGFSPPTLEEVRTNEGTINKSLSAEIGNSFELGSRGSLPFGELRYDASIFYYRLKNTIVDYVSPRGTDLFRNAGSTAQHGLEGAIEFPYSLPVKNGEVYTRLAYTYYGFRYNEYIVQQVDFSGNKIPGVAPHTLSINSRLTIPKGIFFNLNYLFKSQIFLNDENTDKSDSYHLMAIKTGWNGNIKPLSEVEVSIGVNNLFNQVYSYGNDVNAFGRRYYQPSPGRNFFFSSRIYFGK